MKICIVPGSFDPFTLGHLDVVKRAADLFDKVYVAIMINSQKKGMFDFAQRKRIAELSCAGLENVEVITADGLLVDLCRGLGASAVVKGVRDAQDCTYEINMARMNGFIDGSFETVLLPAKPELSFLSSTFVRELMKYEKPLDGALHPDAVAYISVI